MAPRPKRKRGRSRKNGRAKERPPARDPNELELLVARGFARALDFGDAVLEIAERDPERVVRMVEGVIDGTKLLAQAVIQRPDEVKRFARDEGLKFMARVARKKLNETRR